MPRKSTVSCWPFWGKKNQSGQKPNQHFPRSDPEGRRQITEPSLCEITLVPSRDGTQPSGCAPQVNDRKRAGEREGSDHDIRYVDIHYSARRVELDRDLLGIRRVVRAARRKTSRRLDRGISSDHGADQRDRVLFSVPRVFAVSWSRHNFTVGAGGSDLCALRPSPRWRLAQDLRYHRYDCSLSECFRPDRAGFPEGAGPGSDGSDAVRASI